MRLKRLWTKFMIFFWKSLKYGAIGAIVIIAVVGFLNMGDAGTVSDTGPDSIAGENSKEAAIDEEVHQRINDIRDRKGLSELSYDDELAEIARGHSEDMAEKEYFSHKEPDGDTIEDRYQQAGYNCRVSTGGNSYKTAGENIYNMHYEGRMYSAEEIAERTVEGWMDSPGHRKQIVDPNWNKEGIGVAIVERDGVTEVYVTQNFC